MKTYISNSIIILIGLFLANNYLFSQSKFELSGGFGIPDLLNMRVKYGTDFQVSSSVGFLNYKENSNPIQTGDFYYMNYSVDIYYHFAGNSKYTNQKPYWVNIGLGYWVVKFVSDNPTPGPIYNNNDRLLSIYSRIGRTFNLSKKVGITTDIGVMRPLYLDEEAKIISINNLLPAASVSFFIRL